jgi:hypothetical protein
MVPNFLDIFQLFIFINKLLPMITEIFVPFDLQNSFLQSKKAQGVAYTKQTQLC